MERPGCGGKISSGNLGIEEMSDDVFLRHRVIIPNQRTSEGVFDGVFDGKTESNTLA